MPRVHAQGFGQQNGDCTMKFNTSLFCIGLLLMFANTAQSAPVWHCSSGPDQLTEESDVSPQDQFGIAASGNEIGVIQVSLKDIYDVFSGASVRVSGVSLSACFNLDDTPSTQEALRSLGMESNTLQRLVKRANIVQSHVYAVRSNASMASCIEKHHPAIGYLPVPLKTDRMGPCF